MKNWIRFCRENREAFKEAFYALVLFICALVSCAVF